MERKNDQSAKNEEMIKKIKTFLKYDFSEFSPVIIKRRRRIFGIVLF